MSDILKVAINNEQNSQTLKLVTSDEQRLGFHSKELNSFDGIEIYFLRDYKSHTFELE